MLLLVQYSSSLLSTLGCTCVPFFDICSDFDGFNRTTISNESVIEIPIPVALNSDVALKCDVLDANPPPQIKWFHDQGEIQEVMQNNMVRFLDNRRYLYLRRLQPAHLERRYYCVVTNTNLSHEVSAPTRYVLTDNLTQGVLMDYKQIGDLTAFVRNTSFEFAYVGGVFGNNSNLTTCRLRWNQTNEVGVLGNIGKIVRMSLPGNFTLKATVLVHLNKNGVQITKSGTLTMNREFFLKHDHGSHACMTDNTSRSKILHTLPFFECLSCYR